MSVMLFGLLACTAAAAGQAMPTNPGAEAMKETACPWLTQGTAADLLGGEVTATVTESNSAEGTCRFVRDGAEMNFIEIQVSAAPLHACPVGSTPLTGVGNEAERCRVAQVRGITEEMAGGNVRSLHFTVVISGRGSRRSGKPSDADDNLARLADEVAGNLY
ncbi:MAG TPA: hypothetical protein VHU89_08585 [Acidobacteriaceae bacterium]|jgi:hypothetical protein|nr:hypothetical protein [Acidobacteriaceae bacterium]